MKLVAIKFLSQALLCWYSRSDRGFLPPLVLTGLLILWVTTWTDMPASRRIPLEFFVCFTVIRNSGIMVLFPWCVFTISQIYEFFRKVVPYGMFFLVYITCFLHFACICRHIVCLVLFMGIIKERETWTVTPTTPGIGKRPLSLMYRYNISRLCFVQWGDCLKGFSLWEIRQARSHCEKKRHIVLSFKVINSSICRFRNNLSGRIPLCLWTCVRVECEDSLAKSVAKIMISLTICALQRRFFVSIRQFFFSEEAEDVEDA